MQRSNVNSVLGEISPPMILEDPSLLEVLALGKFSASRC
jgi:hypothetical protein